MGKSRYTSGFGTCFSFYSRLYQNFIASYVGISKVWPPVHVTHKTVFRREVILERKNGGASFFGGEG